MTQFTAQLTAAQQQVPGVTYTLNPTAEAFEPEGDRKSEEEGEEGKGKGKGGQ